MEVPESLFSWCLLGVFLFYAPFVAQGFICWFIIAVTGKRIHYIEIHEESWCPQWLRDVLLVQLQGGWQFFGANRLIGGLSPAQTLGEIMSKILFSSESKYEQMTLLLDTCSGASGPTHIVHSQLFKRFQESPQSKNADIPFCTLLSDLWPDVPSWQRLSKNHINLGYLPGPTDATNVQIDEKTLLTAESKKQLIKSASQVVDYAIESRVKHKHRWLRSLFSGFHHLRPPQAELVIYDTIKNGDGLIIAERMHQRIFVDLIKWPPLLTLIAPVKWLYSVAHVWSVFETKRARKESEIGPLVWWLIKETTFVTLVQPVCLMVYMHDACTSAARTYLFSECEEMVAKGLDRVAREKGYEKGSKEYTMFVESYEFKAWIQPTLAPQPWGNLVKHTCFSLLPRKQNFET